jgi:hypothetical protein
MKKTYFTLFFSLIFYITYAQISVKYATANDNQLWQIVKKSNGNYLLVINTADITQSPIVSYTKIIEMNSMGKFIDSIVLKSDSLDFFIDKLIPVPNGYIGLGGSQNRNNSRPLFWVFRLNNQLQRIQDTVIPLKRDVAPVSVALDKDCNIIFTAWDIYKFNYFGKINKNGMIKSWKIDSSILGLPANPLIVRKDSLLYTIFYGYRFVTFDTSFNKIHESRDLFGNTSIGFSSSVIPLNDSIVCVAGKASTFGSVFNGWRHFFGVTTLNGREVFQKIYSTDVDTAIWGAFSYGVDTTKLGEFYWGGTYNLIFGALGHSSFSSSFLLHKLNRNYTTKWTKKYGGDAYYEMYGVLAKDDGGCLMYGTRYDYNNTPKYDAYILNVDADGLVTSESFIPLSLHPLSIFPNPSNGLVNFEYKEPLKDIEIRVIDAKGSLVNQIKMPDGMLPSLDLSFLSNGVYFIQIMEQNRLFSVSRWVKGL